jgi:hypothetical protein
MGILLALVGFPLLLGGLGLGWAMATQRDDDGFFSTPTEQLTTETVALSSEAVNLGEAGPDDWWADRDLATVRLSARSADASAFVAGVQKGPASRPDSRGGYEKRVAGNHAPRGARDHASHERATPEGGLPM